MEYDRYYRLDYLKFFAAFFVVCIHTCPFLNTTILSVNGFYLYFIIDTMARFAVPFFFVSSGFLFMKKIMTNKGREDGYCKKYLMKIAKLYFGWAIFYFAYNLIVKNQTSLIPDLNIIAIAKFLAFVFYYGYGSPHLWFLTALFWSIGIIYIFIKNNKIKELLIISFLLNIVGLFGNSYRGIWYLPITSRNALFFGLFYCTIGACFAYYEREIRKGIASFGGTRFAQLFWIFCILQMIERYILVRYFGGSMDYEFFVSTIPLSVSLFLWGIENNRRPEKTWIANIGENTLGIYIIHYFWIGIITDILILAGIASNTVTFQILLPSLIFFISYFTYKYIQQIFNWIKVARAGI